MKIQLMYSTLLTKMNNFTKEVYLIFKNFSREKCCEKQKDQNIKILKVNQQKTTLQARVQDCQELFHQYKLEHNLL